MALYHIAQGSGLVVKSASLFYSHIFDSGNFDVVNIIPVPQRFEYYIGKSQGQHILYCFFAQKVVDPVNLVFLENRSIETVQLFG